MDMKDISEFFQGLFATDKWPARWKCGEWSDFHGWVYILSELMIWTAYFLMPVIILKYFSNKKAVIKFQKVYVLFASFILLCGSTHFLDALMFWVPMYRLNALVRLATGIVSLFTLYHLIKILPTVFKQKTNIELEKEIQRREEAERDLAEANKNLQAFAYVASHDLQEPLRKINTFTDLLLKNNTATFDDRSKLYAKKIMSSTDRMSTMIKDVLTLSTINKELELTNASPTVAAKNALEDLEIKILETHAVVNIGDIPEVKGNQVYLTQLFMNLIGNAIKFSKEDPVIDITGEEKGSHVLIYVKDNGIGINENDVDKIFSPFQRLHKQTEYEGSGIGLSICQKIIDVHGGSIRIKSRVGLGTTFIIELPKADDQFE
jgi:signal transduction histidine kinase